MTILRGDKSNAQTYQGTLKRFGSNALALAEDIKTDFITSDGNSVADILGRLRDLINNGGLTNDEIDAIEDLVGSSVLTILQNLTDHLSLKTAPILYSPSTDDWTIVDSAETGEQFGRIAVVRSVPTPARVNYSTMHPVSQTIDAEITPAIIIGVFPDNLQRETARVQWLRPGNNRSVFPLDQFHEIPDGGVVVQNMPAGYTAYWYGSESNFFALYKAVPNEVFLLETLDHEIRWDGTFGPDAIAAITEIIGRNRQPGYSEARLLTNYDYRAAQELAANLTRRVQHDAGDDLSGERGRALTAAPQPGLAEDADYVYWIGNALQNRAIQRMDKQTQVVSALALQLTANDYGLALDEDGDFWTCRRNATEFNLMCFGADGTRQSTKEPAATEPINSLTNRTNGYCLAVSPTRVMVAEIRGGAAWWWERGNSDGDTNAISTVWDDVAHLTADLSYFDGAFYALRADGHVLRKFSAEDFSTDAVNDVDVTSNNYDDPLGLAVGLRRAYVATASHLHAFAYGSGYDAVLANIGTPHVRLSTGAGQNKLIMGGGASFNIIGTGNLIEHVHDLVRLHLDGYYTKTRFYGELILHKHVAGVAWPAAYYYRVDGNNLVPTTNGTDTATSDLRDYMGVSRVLFYHSTERNEQISDTSKAHTLTFPNDNFGQAIFNDNRNDDFVFVLNNLAFEFDPASFTAQLDVVANEGADRSRFDGRTSADCTRVGSGGRYALKLRDALGPASRNLRVSDIVNHTIHAINLNAGSHPHQVAVNGEVGFNLPHIPNGKVHAVMALDVPITLR